MKKIAFLLFAGVLISTSCDKEKGINTLMWDETGCADPWADADIKTDEDRKRAITSWLEEQDVRVKTVKLSTDENKQQACLACSCTTGKVYEVSVKSKYKDKMLELNFYE